MPPFMLLELLVDVSILKEVITPFLLDFPPIWWKT